MNYIFNFLISLSIMLVAFQGGVVHADEEIRVDPDTALRLAQKMDKDIVRLMKYTAKINKNGKIGSNCFFPKKNGYAKLLSFYSAKDVNQPNGDFEKKMFNKLKSNANDKGKGERIEHDCNNGIFYYMSLVNNKHPSCKGCHKHEDNKDKFDNKLNAKYKSLGAIFIKIPVE